MRARYRVGVLALALLAGCDWLATGASTRLVLESDFVDGSAGGWQVDFADLPTGDTTIYELTHGVRALPTPLDTLRSALYVQGHNRSDDLFIFLTRELRGLMPGATYDIRYEIEIATNAGSGCIGAGGAPGESVYLKTGATGAQPAIVLDELGWRRVSFDKGNQAVGGAEAVVIGDLANGSTRCDAEAPYLLKSLSSAGEPIRATADSSGRLWLIVGTDSAFEGLTGLYYALIRVTLEG